MEDTAEQQETIADVCTTLGITATSVATDKPAPWSDKDEHPMDAFTVTLHYQGRTLVQDYWQGIGHREWIVLGNVTSLGEKSPYDKEYTAAKGWHTIAGGSKSGNPKELPPHLKPTLHHMDNAQYRSKPPEAHDVLGCLCSDARSVDSGQTFEDFASELGLDTDSRKAERMYHECQGNALRLRGFLGEAYDRCCSAEY